MIRYKQLGYVALNVTDLDRSEAFYRDLVGVTARGEPGPQGARLFRTGPGPHGLILFQGAAPGLKRIGFELESAQAREALCAALDAAGVDWNELDPAEADAWGLGRCVRVVEPHTTAVLDFYESRRDLGGPAYASTVAQIQRLGHIVLKTPQLADTARFFREVLNFRVSDEVDGAIVFMRAFPNPYHHCLALGRSAQPALHHVNLMVSEVDDIGRAFWRFGKAGVPVVFGPGRHPPSGSLFLYFLDPDALTVEYSFGMEEFPERDARAPRTLKLAAESIDEWGAPHDPRKYAVGSIETPTPRPRERQGA
ncbi:MAG: VOC family protein [Burkholderiales bacterium]|nr:VOC family protein [Burkholderiales bacterium]ODU62172.1 MAG: hypothetical protein ABT05_08005 [Lautropia sp. SCN 66-9]